MPEDKAQVRISKKLHEEIEKRIRSGNLKFESVDGFVEFALTELLDIPTAQEMSPGDQETVSKRLQSFGY
jgi:Arc/MetJ-type ribon-helix-helix transcriptional regulator